jgi:NAD(P) transhydrogenase subunit alpha
MSQGQSLALGCFVFALALAVGFELITRVPATLHTPLMSGTNAIHGIVLVGALVVAAGYQGIAGALIAFLAVLFGTVNVVGGFVVTDRMLEMFRRRPSDAPRRED